MIAKPSVASFDEFVAPMVAFNKIALSYTERLIDLNLSMLRKQADMTLAGWSEILAVKNADEAKNYLTHQSEVARKVVEEYVADAKTVTELNQEVADNVRKVVEESITKASKQAA